MTHQPWMKFYPADWRSDPSLRITSLAGRGLWIEMLAIMHEANPRGHLIVNGKPLSAESLSLMVGSDAETVKKLVEELEENGVFSRKKSGVIFSRRIEKDENKSRKNRENGKLGGNPSLCNQTENGQPLNHEVKAKKPEARNQKPDSSSDEEHITGAKKRSSKKSKAIVDNEILVGILSDVLDQEHSQAIIEHRESMRKPLGERAAKMLVKELRSCPNANDAVDQMIMRGWVGIQAHWLAEKPRFQSQAPPKPKSEHVLRHEAFEREFNRVINGASDEPDSNIIDLAARDYRSFGAA